ncbi:MAG: thioredoxin domain-containing protein [Vulcanisaeta sp.]|jgi:hypothetical protein|uniref:thioredoxin domain-containing protein n=1 Tax=Vulcanisaeta sp. TaxID=2020871 RepID=UPI003D0D73A6
MSSNTSINRMLLVAVIVLAVALAVILIYFLILKPPTTTTHQGKSSSSSSSSQSSTSAQTSMITLAFERGVENWLGLMCVYDKYGSNATLGLLNDIYTIAYSYIYKYAQTNNITYQILFPIAQYQYLTSKYSECTINESDQHLVNIVLNTLNDVNTMAIILNIPSNLLGTPLFIVFDRVNNVTYVLAGASPYVFYAIDYAKAGNLTVLVYRGQELGYGFKANSAQVSFINKLISSGLSIGNVNANVTVIEFLDPECSYCAIFQLEYGGYLEQLISNGTIHYVIQYFPTHVLAYGCSTPTIASMLGTICQG